ncbi:lysozyme [Helicobacter pylori]
MLDTLSWQIDLSGVVFDSGFRGVFAFHLYRQTGHPTIGYGYNLSVYSYESKRITKAYGLLIDTLKENYKVLLSYGWYKNLDAMRRMVILDLSYNLGLNGLLKFKQFIKAIEDKNYALAVERLQKSPYFNQVKKERQGIWRF